MLIAVADTVWNALIAGVVTVVLAYMTHRAAEKAAKKVEEVKSTLETSTTRLNDKLNNIAIVGEETKVTGIAAQKTGIEAQKTGEQILVHVNNAFGVQLKLNAGQAKRIADMTKNPADIEAWKESERLYREHMAKQELVDQEKNAP